MDGFAWPIYALRRLKGRAKADFSDEELVSRAASGSVEDFEILIRRYSASIYRTVYRLCGSAEDAEDIVQETFVKAFKALPTVDLERPIKPWLYKIAVNTAVSQLRKNSGRRQVEWNEADAPPVPDGSAAIAEKLDVQAALERLSIDDRRIIVLRAIEDLSFAEVAEVLDIPEATARTRFHRARQLLKNRL